MWTYNQNIKYSSLPTINGIINSYGGVEGGVEVGVGVTIGKDYNLGFGGALFWLKVLGKTFCPVVICPGTINRDPLAIVPDLFLKSNPIILFY